MEDYTGNSKREKEGLGKDRPQKKKVEKVVSGEVVVQKKSFGRKVRDLFVEADLRGVSRYVISDILIPSLRNMIVDASTKGIERVMYGASDPRRRYLPGQGPRITYSTPVQRHPGWPIPAGAGPRQAPALQAGPRMSRQARDDVVILATRSEAELVLERLGDIIDKFEVASVGDLHDLLGLPQTHVDQKWGWTYVGDASIRQVREGYLLDLPLAAPIE